MVQALRTSAGQVIAFRNCTAQQSKYCAVCGKVFIPKSNRANIAKSVPNQNENAKRQYMNGTEEIK